MRLRSRNGSLVNGLLSMLLLASVACALLGGVALLGSVPVDQAELVEETPPALVTVAGAPVLPQSVDPRLQRVVTRWGTCRVALHDLRSGEVLQFLPEHGGDVISVEISRDGERHALSYHDGCVIFSGERPQSVRRVWLDETPTGLVLTADGRQAAAAVPSGSIYLWDAQSGELADRLEIPGSFANCLAFSPDGRCLAVGGPGAVSLWDVASGKRLHAWPEEPAVTALRFSADGRMLAVGGFEDLVLRKTDSGERLWIGATGGTVRSLAFSPDGQSLAVACDQRVRLWETSSGALLVESSKCGEIVESVAFSADGRQVLFATRGGVIHQWDAASGQELSRVTLSARCAK